ncbi:MAG: hypothetical protein HY858_15685 [Candidatus Solibacter usitatus]|nr:hypothetical protein [Candidatus Solibacter usitatus]
MNRLLCVAILLAAGGLALSGQRVFLASEFQRLRPDGETAAADRVERRREILSPAVARNAWATFRVAVEAPPNSSYHLYIAQNPDDSCKPVLYQEEYSKLGGEYLPDAVKRLDTPLSATLPEGQKIQTYLLDIWVPDSTPTGRFRLEIQLNSNDRWVIYPLEIRVREALVPATSAPAQALPPPSSRIDSAALAALREYICAAKPGQAAGPPANVRAFVDRNVRQDLALARVRESEEPRDGIAGMLLKAGGWPSTQAFCEAGSPAPGGAEWWLRARDYLYQKLPVP